MKYVTASRFRASVVGAFTVLLISSATIAYAQWALPEQQVTTNASQQWRPDISGANLVYEDFRETREVGEVDDPDTLYRIYALDLTTMTEKRVSASTPSAMGRPAVAGDYVVWEDYGNGTTTRGIWYYNLKTGTRKRLPIKPGQSLEISGHRLVYEYGNDIYTYNLRTGVEKKITSDDKSHSPDISGTKIVWQHNGSTLDFDIYSYDIATGVTKRLTTLAAEQAQNPAIAGDKVVWEDRRNVNFDVYLYDLATSTERRITTNTSDQNYPAVSGNTIVWQDWRHGNNQIYLYDVAVGTEQRMTNNVHDQSEPAISGDRIVYTDGRNGNYDIYMSRIATPGFTLIGPSSVAYDATALMTGTLESADGFVLPGKAVTIQVSKDKKTWTSTNSTVTAAGGSFSIESPQLRTARYLRVRFAGDTSYPSATSGAVLVRPRLSFSSAPKFKTSTLKYGRTYAVWGYFKPEHSSGSKQIRVKAYRYNGSSWIYKRTYSTKTSNTSASSYTKYKGYVRLPSKGTWRLRAYHATDSKNAKSYSDYRTVTVK